jgi:two-component system sensor kinase FixL
MHDLPRDHLAISTGRACDADGVAPTSVERSDTGPIDATRPAASPRRRPRSIRTMLIWAVVASVVPVWIVVAIGILAYYQREREHLAQSTIATATALMATVDRDLAWTTATLQTLADSDILRSDDLAAFHKRASRLIPQLGTNIVLISPTSGQLVNTLVPYGDPLPSSEVMPQTRKVLETAGPVVSDILLGALAKARMVAIEVPVFRGNEIKYTLAADFDLDRFGELLNQQGLPPNWITSVFDASGVFVSRSHDPEHFVGQKGGQVVLKAIVEAASGVVESKTRDGIPVFAAFKRSELSHWAVVIRVPISELSGGLRTSLLFGGTGAFILLSFGIALAGFQSRQIARSVQALIAPALALGRGEVPNVPRLPVREVDDVAQALDRAFGLLRHRTMERDHAQQEKQEAETALSESERRVMEAQKESDQWLRDITDNLTEGLVISTMEGRLLRWNKAARTMFGFDNEADWLRALPEFVETFELHTLDGRLLELAEWPLARVIAGEQVRGLELRIRRFSIDRQLTLSFSGAIVSDDAGKAVAFLSFADITERQRAEEELRRAHTGLESRVRERTAELEGFAYAASHDLKAPLRVIDNASKWLEEDLAEHLTGENRENMQLLRGRVGRMERLLDDLLEYSRIGRATDGRYAEIITGDVLMDNILVLLSPPTGITVKVSPEFAGVHVCRMPLQQILMNLVSNAIKHHHEKTGCIEATVEDLGTQYAFAVKDDGPGIPAQFHEQIFKMFQTLKPRDQVEGSGMGLAMVRKNIEVFGGTLGLDSVEGRGSVFRFTWPKQQQMRRDDT